MNSITHTEPPSKRRGLSKTTVTYWLRKVYQETTGTWRSSNYYVRFQVAGERRKVRLDATTKEEAGKEALRRYLEAMTIRRNEKKIRN